MPGVRRTIEPASVVIAITAVLAVVTSSGVGDHYFGALAIDRVSRTTWIIAIVAVLIHLLRPFGRHTPDGRAKVVVLVPTGISLLVVATWAVRLWADSAAPPWIARVVISSMAKAEETAFGPGVGALFVLVAFAVALGSPARPGPRSVVIDRRRAEWLAVTLGGSAALIAGLLMPVGEFATGTVGHRTLLEAPGSGPLLAVGVSTVFVAALALRALDRAEESHLAGWQIGVGVAGLASHPAALALDGPPVVPVAPFFSAVGCVAVIVAGIRLRRGAPAPDDPAILPGAERRVGTLFSVFAASCAVALVIAPWRRQVVPSSGAGDVVSVDRGIDLMASWTTPLLAAATVGTVVIACARLTPSSSPAAASASVAAASVGIVVGSRSVAVLLDGDTVGRFGGDVVVGVTVISAIGLAVIAAAAAVPAIVPASFSTGRGPLLVAAAMPVAASIAVAGGVVIGDTERPTSDVLLETDHSGRNRVTVELGVSHGTVAPGWQLLGHTDVALISDQNGAFYEIIDGRPHLASPFDAGFAAELHVFDDLVVVDGQNLEMFTLGVEEQPVQLSSPLELAALTVEDGAWWVEVVELAGGAPTPIVPLAERVVAATDEPPDLAVFEVSLDVARRADSGLRLTPDDASPFDAFVEVDPACDVLRDARSSFGAIIAAGPVVDGVAIAMVTDGRDTRRLVRIAADGTQDELLAPEHVSLDRVGDENPIGATVIGGRIHLSLGGTLFVVDDLDDLAAPLPSAHPESCVPLEPLPTLSLEPIVDVPSSAYAPGEGPLDPLRFSYFSGRGTGYKLIEVLDGVRNDRGAVPASTELVEFGPFDLGGDLVMIVADAPPEADDAEAELLVGLVSVGDDPDAVRSGDAPGVVLPGGRLTGIVPMGDRAVIAAGAGLHELDAEGRARSLTTFDADIATVTGDGRSVVVALLENGEIHRIDGLDDDVGGPITTTRVFGRAPDEAPDKPIAIQLQLDDDPLDLQIDGSTPDIADRVGLTIDGDDLLVLVDDILIRVGDGRAVTVGSTTDFGRGQLQTGVDGPLWFSSGRISRLVLPG
ncbi:MAG: hypothetical protein AAFP84_01770 [Actinomycetota bacterium]